MANMANVVQRCRCSQCGACCAFFEIIQLSRKEAKRFKPNIKWYKNYYILNRTPRIWAPLPLCKYIRKSGDKFYCDIQGEKPKTCLEFSCDDLSELSRDERKCFEQFRDAWCGFWGSE